MPICIFTHMHSRMHIVYTCVFTHMRFHTHTVYTNIHTDTMVLHSDWGVFLIVVLTTFTKVIIVSSLEEMSLLLMLWLREAVLSPLNRCILPDLLAFLCVHLSSLSSSLLPSSLLPDNDLFSFRGLSDSKCSSPSKEKRLACRQLSWLPHTVVLVFTLWLGIFAQVYATHPNFSLWQILSTLLQGSSTHLMC